MPWALIQEATEATWNDYEAVNAHLNVDEDTPDGLIMHAAGEVDGHWKMVDIWESEAAYERFRESRLMPAVLATMGEQAMAAGPPPTETFEVKHLVRA
jgi:hypothetical protein